MDVEHGVAIPPGWSGLQAIVDNAHAQGRSVHVGFEATCEQNLALPPSTPPALDELRATIRSRIPHFIPDHPQSWFNLGSLGGIRPDKDGHALYLHAGDSFQKVDPIHLSNDEAWMLGESLLIAAEYARLEQDR